MSHAPGAPTKIDPKLAVGIFFLPLVFAWYTLRPGHSPTTRMVAFG
jgi:hypothetical protein